MKAGAKTPRRRPGRTRPGHRSRTRDSLAEKGRREAETQRRGAEKGRVEAERIRIDTEGLRKLGEGARVNAEQARRAADEARKHLDEVRRMAEDLRRRDELIRKSAEDARRATASGFEAEIRRAVREEMQIAAEMQRTTDALREATQRRGSPGKPRSSRTPVTRR